MLHNIKTIAFDADDTLWENENYFREAEHEFCHLMMPWLPHEKTAEELFKTEMQNLDLLGYGSTAFTLSLVETAARISKGQITGKQIEQIINIGKRLLSHPLHLLPDAQEVLSRLQGKYRLVLATKGELLEQRRKIQKSALEPYFECIEIMSSKTTADYRRLFKRLQANPQETVMVGNSVKSDILPPLELGAWAIYVPFHTTWKHEEAALPQNPRFRQAEKLRDILAFLL